MYIPAVCFLLHITGMVMVWLAVIDYKGSYFHDCIAGSSYQSEVKRYSTTTEETIFIETNSKYTYV